MPAWVTNAMPSYSKLPKHNTSGFAARCYLQGRVVVIGSSDQSGAQASREECYRRAKNRETNGSVREKGKG